MLAAYKIEWTEYERGWGSRPDGTSYHLSKEDALKCIEEHWEREKAMNGDETPDEYSSPSDPILVEVTPEIKKKLKKGKPYWTK